MAQTDFSNKVSILAELYSNYRYDDGLKDFIEYNDLGLPLAFLASEGLAQITEDGAGYIEETFLLFLSSLSLEDEGFETLIQIFDRG